MPSSRGVYERPPLYVNLYSPSHHLRPTRRPVFNCFVLPFRLELTMETKRGKRPSMRAAEAAAAGDGTGSVRSRSSGPRASKRAARSSSVTSVNAPSDAAPTPLGGGAGGHTALPARTGSGWHVPSFKVYEAMGPKEKDAVKNSALQQLEERGGDVTALDDLERTIILSLRGKNFKAQHAVPKGLSGRGAGGGAAAGVSATGAAAPAAAQLAPGARGSGAAAPREDEFDADAFFGTGGEGAALRSLVAPPCGGEGEEEDEVSEGGGGAAHSAGQGSVEQGPPAGQQRPAAPPRAAGPTRPSAAPPRPPAALPHTSRTIAAGIGFGIARGAAAGGAGVIASEGVVASGGAGARGGPSSGGGGAARGAAGGGAGDIVATGGPSSGGGGAARGAASGGAGDIVNLPETQSNIQLCASTQLNLGGGVCMGSPSMSAPRQFFEDIRDVGRVTLNVNGVHIVEDVNTPMKSLKCWTLIRYITGQKLNVAAKACVAAFVAAFLSAIEAGGAASALADGAEPVSHESRFVSLAFSGPLAELDLVFLPPLRVYLTEYTILHGALEADGFSALVAVISVHMLHQFDHHGAPDEATCPFGGAKAHPPQRPVGKRLWTTIRQSAPDDVVDRLEQNAGPLRFVGSIAEELVESVAGGGDSQMLSDAVGEFVAPTASRASRPAKKSGGASTSTSKSVSDDGPINHRVFLEFFETFRNKRFGDSAPVSYGEHLLSVLRRSPGDGVGASAAGHAGRGRPRGGEPPKPRVARRAIGASARILPSAAAAAEPQHPLARYISADSYLKYQPVLNALKDLGALTKLSSMPVKDKAVAASRLQEEDASAYDTLLKLEPQFAIDLCHAGVMTED
jgi:hypothetical protein